MILSPALARAAVAVLATLHYTATATASAVDLKPDQLDGSTSVPLARRSTEERQVEKRAEATLTPAPYKLHFVHSSPIESDLNDTLKHGLQSEGGGRPTYEDDELVTEIESIDTHILHGNRGEFSMSRFHTMFGSELPKDGVLVQTEHESVVSWSAKKFCWLIGDEGRMMSEPFIWFKPFFVKQAGYNGITCVLISDST